MNVGCARCPRVSEQQIHRRDGVILVSRIQSFEPAAQAIRGCRHRILPSRVKRPLRREFGCGRRSSMIPVSMNPCSGAPRTRSEHSGQRREKAGTWSPPALSSDGRDRSSGFDSEDSDPFHATFTQDSLGKSLIEFGLMDARVNSRRGWVEVKETLIGRART